jgi:hypothetical protein
VADYREALIRRKRQDEARRERERMVEMLVSYRNKTEKLEDGEKPSGPKGDSG